MNQDQARFLDMFLNLYADIEFLEDQAKKQLARFEESQADKDNAIYYQLNVAIDYAGKMRSSLELIVNDQC